MVRPTRHLPPRFRGFWIDAPVAGTAVQGEVLRIAGWAVGASEPVGSVDLFCQGACLRRIAINRPRPDVARQYSGAPDCVGFVCALTTAELPREFEIELMATSDKGELAPLATLTGRHTLRAPPAIAPGKEYLRPLMVTSLGRMGTTYLMRMLSEHPRIVAERLYPYETKAGAYWMHMLRTLM